MDNRKRESRAIAELIRLRVLAAMQDADEIGGPDPAEYVDLMRAIAAEATRCADTCATAFADEIAASAGP